jgi:prevent-host-death family protein
VNNVYISSSELKRNVAEILNSVYFGKKIAVVKRYGKIVAKIIPVDKKEDISKKIHSLLNKYFGVLPDFPDVSKTRNFRKRSVKL